MTLKVGVVGLGFMGKMHFDTYRANPETEVTFIFDLDKKKLEGDWSSIGGNIATGDEAVDLSGITLTDNYDELLNGDLDIIDICLPTFSHAEYAIKALDAGKHVFLEKPMSNTVEDAKNIAEAAKKAGKKLQIGQCIRFWPEYEALKKIIDEKIYGEVKSAVFTRLSPCPTWSWSGWLMDPEKSGAAALDLHIHDTDFVNFVFGRPKSVTSRGSSLMTTGFDHIITSYNYGDGRLVSAEGGWMGMPAFPFRMEFQVMLEEASIEFNANGFKAYTRDGETVELDKPDGDGYSREIQYFVDCINNDTEPEIVTAEDAIEAVEICLAEIESAKTGKEVSL